MKSVHSWDEVFFKTKLMLKMVKMTNYGIFRSLFYCQTTFETYDLHHLGSLSSRKFALWISQHLYEPAHEIRALFVLRNLTHSSNARARPSTGAKCLIFCRTLRLLPYFMCANSEGSGETARMRRLVWAFAGHLCDKYHNLMSWLNYETCTWCFRYDVVFKCTISRTLSF